jgi:hypothetical protein
MASVHGADLTINSPGSFIDLPLSALHLKRKFLVIIRKLTQ